MTTMTTTQGATGLELAERYSGALMNTFGAPQRVLVRGEGAYVWDADGNRYLDLLAGIAVNALGHAHPTLVSAIAAQLGTLGHVSNFFATPTQVALAELLLELSVVEGAQPPAGTRVFFTNSGTEANEAALKMARLHGRATGATRVLALEHSFHGRTMGALSLTSKAAYREPFEPLPGGVEFIPAGDVEALRTALEAGGVAALFAEPVQGEAGVRPLPPGYLAAARELTRQHGALLVLDEVQTGIGRCGAWLAHQLPQLGGGIVPDVVTLAKGLGGGFPIGAVIGYGEAGALFGPGNHGTTFGGNPVAAAAALATLHVIERDGLLAHVARLGESWRTALAAVPGVAEARGEGLLVAVELTEPVAADVQRRALDAGFVVNAPTPTSLRLAPPLVLTAEQAESFTAALPGFVDAAVRAASAAPSRETPA
ncbi:MAG: acetylornithine transaminase [Micrococcales bacterium 73-15]|uniref:acetylornithine transaminase n=1 Tax=Salana multivorans TaxID=120377 RepID=UPI00095BE6AA|nr:acetylornithine transaminase [Salana multivorans]OJX95570.1 MAG: acetylornithine transaminase [Micrococcales bacterium 73-15]